MHLVNNNIGIAILSEIWVKDLSDCSIPDYHFFGKRKEHGYGGGGTFIRSNIKFIILQSVELIEKIEIHTLNLKKNIKHFTEYLQNKSY